MQSPLSSPRLRCWPPGRSEGKRAALRLRRTRWETEAGKRQGWDSWRVKETHQKTASNVVMWGAVKPLIRKRQCEGYGKGRQMPGAQRSDPKTCRCQLPLPSGPGREAEFRIPGTPRGWSPGAFGSSKSSSDGLWRSRSPFPPAPQSASL